MNGFAEMSFIDKVRVYNQFDAARHADLQQFAEEYESMRSQIYELKADLEEERKNRRSYRMKAEAVEQSIGRKFAVMLIDGDGYHFNRRFYMNGSGDQAASSLLRDVQSYLQEQHGIHDMELVVNIFFNKSVPARLLQDSDIIQRPGQFDEFLWSFTSSNGLFQYTDCGPGKERADAKLRDTYKFWLSNAQCQHIFLACCHDNGYVAELDKYRYQHNATSKTILVKHGNTANGFYNLNLPFVRFESTFEMDPIQPAPQAPRRVDPLPTYTPTYTPNSPRTTRIPSPDIISQTSAESSGAVISRQSSTTTATNSIPWATVTASRPRPNTSISSKSVTSEPQASKTGIPVNRFGQRIDRKITVPTTADIDRFEDRIRNKRKMCNSHHLSANGCYSYNCPFDHGQIDKGIKDTLRYKARSIPCGTGSGCRKADCYYGHQCLWGNNSCSNPKCAFYKNDLHEINDFKIVDYMEATEN